MCILFELVNGNAPDTLESYAIDLSEYEQELIYARVNEECVESFGKTCEELLEKARKEMIQVESDKALEKLQLFVNKKLDELSK